MRYQIKGDHSAEELLDHLAQAAYQVVEGTVPESVVEDIRVGFYVAFHQVLADHLVKLPECGTLPACEDLRMENPFATSGVAVARSRN